MCSSWVAEQMVNQDWNTINLTKMYNIQYLGQIFSSIATKLLPKKKKKPSYYSPRAWLTMRWSTPILEKQRHKFQYNISLVIILYYYLQQYLPHVSSSKEVAISCECCNQHLQLSNPLSNSQTQIPQTLIVWFQHSCFVKILEAHKTIMSNI